MFYLTRVKTVCFYHATICFMCSLQYLVYLETVQIKEHLLLKNFCSQQRYLHGANPPEEENTRGEKHPCSISLIRWSLSEIIKVFDYYSLVSGHFSILLHPFLYSLMLGYFFWNSLVRYSLFIHFVFIFIYIYGLILVTFSSLLLCSMHLSSLF